jgi:putative two-component system response regulator
MSAPRGSKSAFQYESDDLGAVGRIVVVDDTAETRRFVETIIRRDGYTVYAAEDGAAALDLIRRECPDVVISDVLMPKINGIDLCRRLKSDRDTRLIPVILVTGSTEREYRIAGIEAGADDFLTKPVDVQELRARLGSLVRLKRFTDDLESAESVIVSLGAAVEARDGHTRGHCERMASLAAAFGTHLGLRGEEIAALHRGGFLHDVGKIGVPDAILLKPGRLSDDEFAIMKLHTVIGEAVCGELRSLRLVRPIVRSHHERLDGSGYPDGLCGDGIPLLAQIIGIVDVYDALTSDRPYRKRLPDAAAYAELRREAHAGWRNPQLVESFITLVETRRVIGTESPGAAGVLELGVNSLQKPCSPEVLARKIRERLL